MPTIFQQAVAEEMRMIASFIEQHGVEPIVKRHVGNTSFHIECIHPNEFYRQKGEHHGETEEDQGTGNTG